MADDPLGGAAAGIAGAAAVFVTEAVLRSVPAFPRPWRGYAAVAVGVAAAVAVTRMLRRADAGDPHAPSAPAPAEPKPKPTLVPIVLATAATGAVATAYSVDLLAVPRFGLALGRSAAGAAALAVFGGVAALLIGRGRR